MFTLSWQVFVSGLLTLCAFVLPLNFTLCCITQLKCGIVCLGENWSNFFSQDEWRISGSSSCAGSEYKIFRAHCVLLCSLYSEKNIGCMWKMAIATSLCTCTLKTLSWAFWSSCLCFTLKPHVSRWSYMCHVFSHTRSLNHKVFKPSFSILSSQNGTTIYNKLLCLLKNTWKWSLKS